MPLEALCDQPVPKEEISVSFLDPAFIDIVCVYVFVFLNKILTWPIAEGFLLKLEEGCKPRSEAKGPTRLMEKHTMLRGGHARWVKRVKDAEDTGLSRFTYFQSKLLLRVEAKYCSHKT